MATASALNPSRPARSDSSRRPRTRPREQPDPQLAVGLGHSSLERFAQQRDDLRVGAGPEPHEATAVAERGAGELLRVVPTGGRGPPRRGTSPSPSRSHPPWPARHRERGAARPVRDGRQRPPAPVRACSAIASSRAPSSYASCWTARSPASRAELHRSIHRPDREARATVPGELREVTGRRRGPAVSRARAPPHRGCGAGAATGSRGTALRTSPRAAKRR